MSQHAIKVPKQPGPGKAGSNTGKQPFFAPAGVQAHQRAFAFEPAKKLSPAPGSLLQRDPPELLEPDLLENPYVLSDEQLVAVRDRVLGPLRRHDGTGFTTRIRSLSATEASALLDDEAFWREIRPIFRGRALWAVYTILYFNNRLREPDLRLSVNFRANDPYGFMDALSIVVQEIRPRQYYEILREAAAYEFSGSPQRNQILSMISQRNAPGAVERLAVSTRQVHYEENEAGDQELHLYGRQVRRMTVYETGGQLRVVLRIRFISAANPRQSYYFFPDPATPERWRAAIERYWNGKFILDNGVKRLRFTVAPLFYYESGPAVDKEVSIMEDDELSCPHSSDPGRANAGCWFTQSSDETVAHEFGHLLGAADEYNLPGSIAEIPADIRSQLTAEDLEFTTMEGITGRRRRKREGGYDISSLMGSHSRSTDVKARHIRLLVRNINGRLPDGTPHYRIIEL